MEEVITIDGRQFKLTVDRPLTVQERNQVLAEIRKQTGCGTCGPKVASMDNDWQYGGIRSLAPTCTRTTYSSGDTVTLRAAPNGGIGPYAVSFWYNKGAGDVSLGTQSGVAEATTATTTLLVTDAIANGANFSGAGTIQLKVTVADSCPTGGQTCVETCTIGVVCVAPTCNFVVT